MAARGRGAKSGGALPNLRSFGPKTAIFRPKKPPNQAETPKRRETAATLHLRLDFAVSKSPLVPFNSTICPKNAQKGAKKPQNLRIVHQHPETKHGPYLGLRHSNPNSKGT